MKTLGGSFKDLTCKGHGRPVMARQDVLQRHNGIRCITPLRVQSNKTGHKVEGTWKIFPDNHHFFYNPWNMLKSDDEPNVALWQKDMLTFYRLCADSCHYTTAFFIVKYLLKPLTVSYEHNEYYNYYFLPTKWSV